MLAIIILRLLLLQLIQLATFFAVDIVVKIHLHQLFVSKFTNSELSMQFNCECIVEESWVARTSATYVDLTWFSVRKMKWSWEMHINRIKDDRWTSLSPLRDHMTLSRR